MNADELNTFNWILIKCLRKLKRLFVNYESRRRLSGESLCRFSEGCEDLSDAGRSITSWSEVTSRKPLFWAVTKRPRLRRVWVLHRRGQGMWVMNVKIYKGYLWQQNKKKGSSDVILLKNFLPLPFIVLLFQRQFPLNLDFLVGGFSQAWVNMWTEVMGAGFLK